MKLADNYAKAYFSRQIVTCSVNFKSLNKIITGVGILLHLI